MTIVTDEHAFRGMVQPHLRELHVHCYRMLGSVDDADDLLQETLVAAWRGIDGFAGRSSLRTWLYRIATNLCLNAIRNGRRRPPIAPTPPFEPPEPTRAMDTPWLQPYPDAQEDPASHVVSQETMRLAFVAALQTLPPRQTAALLLGDVLGYSAAEVAEILDVRPTVVKGLLQRARASMTRTQPGPRATTEYDEEVARQFAEAFSRDDVDAVVALLSDDAWLTMPPATHEYLGRAAVDGFLRTSARWRDGRYLVLRPTTANGQPAFGCYLASGDTAEATGILVLTIEQGQVTGITRFLAPHLPQRFGLPAELSRSPRAGSW
ncbi:RNA polymerase ECF family sigma subunit [Kribbella amoyensis]|uniref:RNA polymerase sigma factor n=1 Tax=Kribbella amoyensis TaxID=996641 RepID=A0A561BRW3_9ACTN|nr:RNA polymerase subunit sigma-70 [Kribbella amoyensis]TWD81634.1 RNA polymerase ECF family sigma subunit [Kribbella amoyensis]